MSYNGWSNYETWVVSLWMDNDEGSYDYARELAGEVIGDEDFAYPRVTLADRLKDWHEESLPELEASVWSDLLGKAFGNVDWLEIADSLLSEVAEEATTS